MRHDGSGAGADGGVVKGAGVAVVETGSVVGMRVGGEGRVEWAEVEEDVVGGRRKRVRRFGSGGV